MTDYFVRDGNNCTVEENGDIYVSGYKVGNADHYTPGQSTYDYNVSEVVNRHVAKNHNDSSTSSSDSGYYDGTSKPMSSAMSVFIFTIVYYVGMALVYVMFMRYTRLDQLPRNNGIDRIILFVIAFALAFIKKS